MVWLWIWCGDVCFQSNSTGVRRDNKRLGIKRQSLLSGEGSEEQILVSSTKGKCPLPDMRLNMSSSLDGTRVHQRPMPADQLCGQLEQATHQAEDATFKAIYEIYRSQRIWGQLRQEISELDSCCEEALASLAVVVDAASSVAKAAAVFAEMSADTALEAKKRVNEAVQSTKNQLATQRPETVYSATAGSGGPIASDESTKKDSTFAFQVNDFAIVHEELKSLAETVEKALVITTKGAPITELVNSGPDGFCVGQNVLSEPFTESTHIVGAEGVDRSCTFMDVVRSNKPHGHRESQRNDIDGFLIKCDASHEKRAPQDSQVSEFNPSVDARGMSVAEYIGGKGKASLSVEDDVFANENIVYSSELRDKSEGNLINNNNPQKLLLDASEPRRSSRKSQPTSRILEGLEMDFLLGVLKDKRTSISSRAGKEKGGRKRSCGESSRRAH